MVMKMYELMTSDPLRWLAAVGIVLGYGVLCWKKWQHACVIRRNWTGNPSETGQSFRAKLDSRSEATHGVLVVYS